MLIHEKETYEILGACFEVYREMGSGYLEAVYQECLELELTARGVPHVPQTDLRLEFKKRPLKAFYRADFLCYGSVIVEIKALSSLNGDHRAQVLNYLSGTKLKVGLLVNFGHHPKLEYERFVL